MGRRVVKRPEKLVSLKICNSWAVFSLIFKFATMDLMALSIFFAAFLICSLLVFFLSVYGAKEVTFEENLKATGQQTGKSQKKSSKLDTKKKNQAKKLAAKGPADTSEIIPNTKLSQKRFKNKRKKLTKLLWNNKFNKLRKLLNLRKMLRLFLTSVKPIWLEMKWWRMLILSKKFRNRKLN